jgi:hypothetical protein
LSDLCTSVPSIHCVENIPGIFLPDIAYPECASSKGIPSGAGCATFRDW